MYERTRADLGWYEPSGWEWFNVGGACDDYWGFRHIEGERGHGKPREICFRNDPEDEQIAHNSGCTKLPPRFAWTGRTHVSCDDEKGTIWCCPENYPQEYMQNIPSDVSSYEEERQRLLAQEPAAPGDQQPETPDSPTPAPVSRHTFWTRLTHPGAITAMAAIAGGGALFYYLKHRRVGR